MPATPLPVLRGNLELLVLRALAWRRMHGFEISSWLDERGKGRLELLDSALYQALYRLEEKRYIRARWGVTDNKRRARYYELTAAGSAHWREESARWIQYTSAVSAILAPA
jgi:PadR family transcriptional regulator PadR